MSDPIYIFAGGGTGGHLYPGLAVAEQLRATQPAAKIVFACSDRSIDRHILDPTPHAVVVQPVRPMPRSLRGWGGFARAYLRSARQARQMVGDLKPAGVLGLGGFAAGPIVSRAAAVGVPTALLNPDAVPGKANRLLGRRVDVIFTQFEPTAEAFSGAARRKVRRVGCPVRSGFATARRAEAVEHFELRADRRTLLVNGGSLGAASINEAIGQLSAELAELADRWQVLHVTGRSKPPPAGRDASGLHLRVLEYCRRMDLACAAADLVLSRAGAVTVAELTATATPAVLIPYPYHADQHQRLNADALCRAGAAVLCEDARDARLNAQRLRDVLLPVLREPERLGRMQQAAGARRITDAAEQVARWLADGGRRADYGRASEGS